jgi:zinc/manganese transport system permease protein
MVTPAAIAGRLTRRPAQGVAVSVIVALAVTWFGLFVSYYLPYPVSFFITTSVFLLYLLTRIAQGHWT